MLIGQISPILSAAKLPSKKEVVALLLYYKQSSGQIIRAASHSTANHALDVWAKTRIPARLKKHVVDKIESMFREKIQKKIKKINPSGQN